MLGSISSRPRGNPWIRSTWLLPATRIDEQACIPSSKSEGASAPYNEMKADWENPWNEHFIIRISHLSLFTESAH